MLLCWNEIKTRAVALSEEWEHETREDAEAKSFWDAFFNVFGITRRHIASFEEPVKKSDGKGGFIDLLWCGQLLVEHKSRGKNLERAFHQALDSAVDAAYGYKGAKTDAARVHSFSSYTRNSLRFYPAKGQNVQSADLFKTTSAQDFPAGTGCRGASLHGIKPTGWKDSSQFDSLHAFAVLS